jgi:hypothetical protein
MRAVVDPFEGIRIVRPADFLAMLGTEQRGEAGD